MSLVESCRSFLTSYPWEKIKPLLVQKLVTVLDQFNTESDMDKLDIHPNIDRATFDELKNDIVERIHSFEKYDQLNDEHVVGLCSFVVCHCS
jgi:hypothetical protein